MSALQVTIGQVRLATTDCCCMDSGPSGSPPPPPPNLTCTSTCQSVTCLSVTCFLTSVDAQQKLTWHAQTCWHASSLDWWLLTHAIGQQRSQSTLQQRYVQAHNCLHTLSWGPTGRRIHALHVELAHCILLFEALSAFHFNGHQTY